MNEISTHYFLYTTNVETTSFSSQCLVSFNVVIVSIDITDLVPFSEYGSKLTPAVSFESTIIHSVPVDVGGRASHRPWRSFSR